MEYQYNYVAPNKPKSGDENYDEAKGDFYLKLDGTQNKQTNLYQSINANGSNTNNHTCELYDCTNEPDQPQYEILPGEPAEMAQYLAVVHDHDEEDNATEMQYLDVLPEREEEIYSDISDSIKQNALESGQELKTYD